MTPCVRRKLDSAILVMKAVEDRLRRDDAAALNRAMERASDEFAIHYNKRHTCPGSGAGAPARIQSCGRDIPVGLMAAPRCRALAPFAG
jgi:hypothetical protein